MTKRIRPRLQLERLEERSLLSGISTISEYPIPTPSANPWTIASGPDGNLWFIERGANKIGMLNPKTHAVSDFAIPNVTSPELWGIAAGPDGNIWFAGGSSSTVGEINPTTHAITVIKIKGFTAQGGIASGPGGDVWVAGVTTSSGEIASINPLTDAVTNYPISSNTFDGLIRYMTAGPGGTIWFACAGYSLVGELNTATGAVATYNIPNGQFGPTGIGQFTQGPDGNVWFTDYRNNDIDMINPSTGALSVFQTPDTTDVNLAGLTLGADGNLWFTETEGNAIGSINPTTHVITEYPLSAPSSVDIGITTGPDGNLWFTDNGTNSIGVATLTSSQLVVTTQPPASVTAGTPFSLTVQAEGPSGNLLSSFNGTVTVTLANNPGGATLGGTLTATATNGVATFSGLTLTSAAAGYTLDVSASGLGAGGTGAITVIPSAPTQVVVTTEPPSSVTAGGGFGLAAAIEDMYGNVVTSDNASVSVALASGPSGATLGGTLSETASGGVATFSGLSLTRAASGYALSVSSIGLKSSTTSALTVTAGTATGLLIAQEPTSVVVKTAFSLVVEAVDAYGNLVTSDNNTVTIALGNNPTGAKLGGTVSVKFVNGVATFSGLTMSKVGTGYTILISSKNLTGTSTDPFNVTAS